MKTETALFIANLLEEELKEETRNYKEYHSSWTENLIKASEEFFDDNAIETFELDRLIKDYYETKEWYDKKNSQ